jgi:endonuclease III
MNPSHPRSVYEVAGVLRDQYHDFSHYNKSDPFDELLFIICSTKTSEVGYRGTYRALRKRFPRREMLASASSSEIAKVIKTGGLSNKKASAIRGIVLTVMRRFGRLTLSPLKRWSDRECEDFLVSLPGVGRKVARCVMMYALGRQVFPVDEHCWRISKRLGWIRQTRKNRSGSPRDEDRLQSKIAPHLRFSLHVNMISLGRDVCFSISPQCDKCVIRELCPRRGLNQSRSERS